MADLSYLLGVESRAVFPGLGKGRNVNHVVVACAKWKVPLLWFALFSPKDMVQLSSSVVKRLAKQAGEEPYDFELRAPIIARENVTDRLSEARDILNATLPKIKTWDSHLTLLGKSIGRLPKRYTYVTCQWDEIVAMQPKPFYAAAEWLLKFFAGARLRNPEEKLAAITRLKFNRSFRDPAKETADRFTKRDWETLDDLLGGPWEREVPWEPKSSPAVKAKAAELGRLSEEWWQLISDRNVKGVKKILAEKKPILEGFVALAATTDAHILKLLLAAGGNPNDATVLHGSALLAAFNSDKEVSQKVQTLLDAGVDVNHTGLEHPNPFVLGACLMHGMEFARAVLSRADKQSLSKFLDRADTAEFQQSMDAEGITWASEYVALAKEQLASRK